MISKRVLIIGGYGNFGSYIAKNLASDPNIELIIAGRSLSKAVRLCKDLSAINPATPFEMDINDDILKSLKRAKPDIVIHTSGPFQWQDSFVAQACIDYGCHYIDLADGREFVSKINLLNSQAIKKNLLIVSGASSVPCLSSCLLDHYGLQFQHLTHVEYGITTAQHTNRGLATTQAVLSYAGQEFQTLIDGSTQNIYGWQGLHRHRFKGLGTRLLGNCDIPDLAIFPERYPNIKTIRFYAGLEIPVVHLGLWCMTWLRRIKLLPSLDKLAPYLLKLSRVFDIFGTDNSGFFITMKGQDNDGLSKKITFDLTAKSGDGPYIPCMPAIILARKLAAETVPQTGAMPCVGLLTLNEYLDALQPLDISWVVDQ
ncbi:saccharopine dehydrogenase family protein [Kordiimonas sp. SCSIO 12610]|uniref:saccharopine dehydrogenase family protein n=1 Tax=Kordiimonas sp. SCSIO 12610 TaxID=2829597 RepID=UPI002108E98D|nr:saccharopine dehydrogenase NADP-binding domain-containing protein [Kordiimonas sp. SCSIO 12610]UTW56377.1 saccharopine dehydrogenase NADP-binding domain-containing protein [Kordiimonas sp. SCSIO 12610]